MRTSQRSAVSYRTNVTVDCGLLRANALDEPGGVPLRHEMCGQWWADSHGPLASVVGWRVLSRELMSGVVTSAASRS